MSKITTRRIDGNLYTVETTDNMTIKTWGPHATMSDAIRDARVVANAYGAEFAVSIVGQHKEDLRLAR